MARLQAVFDGSNRRDSEGNAMIATKTDTNGYSDTGARFRERVKQLQHKIRRRKGVVEFELYVIGAGNFREIQLRGITIDKEVRGSGIGGEALGELAKLADAERAMVTLYVAGVGSYARRLKRFYGQFGFVGTGKRGSNLMVRRAK